ncbi:MULTISPECIES: hypothetical protein [Pyrobaculum]|uniref:Uncharacterized protein n=1 Tax=Pyrobaculum arsenaticum TaxID=121277 RepID=A0A7L4P797_9CREN|nr:hypothetical protein [Pyrobaculum arsenaticum]MCY0890350.1 hypothetical protein [Pyrobaculum arsenaticum]NYR14692.1 hypothetical protein [Pyrobaculum arsenaticum]
MWYYYGSGIAVAGVGYGMDSGRCWYFTAWDGQRYYGCDNFRSADMINKALGVVGWRW